MARRRTEPGGDSQIPQESYDETPNQRKVAGLGGFYLSRSSRDAIDPLSPRENPWAMAAILSQGISAVWRRPVRSTAVLFAFGLLVSFSVSFARSTILVLAGRAKPVTSDQVTDPTSATQVAAWLGSQVGAPLIKTGSATLVEMSADSMGQESINVDDPQQSPWARQGVEVADRSGKAAPINLIRPQGRRSR